MMLRKKSKMFVDSADQTPHYSLRKLSVGVASVLLSTTLWMGANGSVAHADTINDTTVAGKVWDKLDPSETHKDQTQAQTAESTSQASVASAEKQNGEAQAAVADVNQAENKQAQEGGSANAKAQTTTANDAQADVAKQEPAAQSQQTAPQAQVPASAESQASTAEQAAGQASAAATEGQTNGSANAGAAIDATTKAKKDSANSEANSSDAATEGAKNESTTLDVSQAFKTSTVATVTKKMVMSSLADSISENKTKLAKANADTTAVPGFSVTDPEYPSEMYRDPNPEHYSFFWGGQTGNGYQTVISTNRNGNGQIHVFELDQNNTVLNSFDLDKNQSHTSLQTGVTYYNDEYAGLLSAGSLGGWILPRKWTLKYEVSGGKSDQPYDRISFIVPRLNTQVTSYQDEGGNDIIDNNGEKIEPVVQRGLDGQKYTTTDTKVIDGYYAIAPSNAQGTMSPYGKIGSKYEKNYHDGYIAEYTQINSAGDMSVQMYREDRQGKRTPVNLPIIIKPGDSDIYSGVGNIYLRSIYVPQTTDIRYVYKKLGNTVLVDEDNNPFKGNTPTQYPNDPNDPTKAGKVVIPQYEGYTPKINGVPVGPDGFIPTDPGEDTYVVYTPDPQKATVAYVDDKTGKTLKTDTPTGVTNAKSGYTTADSIKTYQDLGYKLVSDDTKGAEIVFDNEDGKDQSYTVHFIHDTITVDPENPGKPGEPINPGKGSAVYPDGTDKAGLTDTVDRTISYKMSDGSKAPASVKDSLTFTASKEIDKVTGEVLSTEWSKNQDFNDVESPVVKGYTPDKTVVSNKDVAHDAKDIDVVVTYYADAQKATVAYVDDKTGKTLKTDTPTGVTNAKSGYTTADSIKTYQDLGYKLVSDDTKGAEIVFDNEDGKDQSYTVHFIHDTITVDPENPGKPGEPINPGKGSAVYPDGTDKAGLTDTVDRTISYKMSDGSKAPASVKDSLTFTASKEIDKVTGEVLSTEWSKNQDFNDVESPVVKGYTPDKTVVSNKDVAHDAKDIDVVVTYYADAQKATVAYIDDKTGKTLKTDSLTGVTNAKSGYTTADSIKTYQALGYKLVSDDTKGAYADAQKATVAYIDDKTGKTLKTDSLTGVTNAKSGYTTADSIKTYQALGYKLVSDDTKGAEIVFDNEDGKDQSYTVHFIHDTITVDPENPGKPGEPINPGKGSAVYPDGTDKAGLTDTVDRTISYKMSDGSKAPASVKDSLTFTASKEIDKVTGEVLSTEWSKNQDFNDVVSPDVTGYTPRVKTVSNKNVAHDAQNIDVVVIYDADAQKAKVAYIDDKTGKTLKTDSLTGVTNAKSGYTTADSIKTYQALGYKLVSDDTKGAEIVFDNEDGKDQSYTVHFIHDTITVDPENPGKPGEPINPGKGSAVYPDGTDKAGLTDTVDRTISYKMSDGSKAPASVKDSLTFTASKEIDKVTGEVLSTEWSKNQDFKDVVSPDVTGYTPRVKTVSNKNVAHDAQNIDVVVIYDADAQKAKVAYIDDKTGQTIETKTLTGVSNAHSGYSTISTIKDLENKGYKLVSDDTTGSEIVFDNDDTTDQAYAVHLAHRTSVVTPNDPKNPVNGNDMTDDLTKKVHQTIKYVELSGKQAAKSNVQTLTFGRSATVDLVDGTVLSYTDWDGPKSTKAVKSPKVKGFVPDKKIVPAQSYKATDADKVITVAYKAVKKAVPAQTPKAPAKKPAIPVKAPKAVKTAEPAKTISIKESAQAQDQLPQTGEDNSKAAFGLGLASILGGIGILGAFKRKKKEN
jgi:LPXTG-motif cell wall-anchored protein